VAEVSGVEKARVGDWETGRKWDSGRGGTIRVGKIFPLPFSLSIPPLNPVHNPFPNFTLDFFPQHPSLKSVPSRTQSVAFLPSVLMS
jgi:hypothetical protein